MTVLAHRYFVPRVDFQPPPDLIGTNIQVTANGVRVTIKSQAQGLPLDPGETLTLTVNDVYYDAAYSSYARPIPVGARVYAQVDSANTGTTYGAVYEQDEASGAPYNNIASTIAPASALQEPEAKSVVSAKEPHTLPPRPVR